MFNPYIAGPAGKQAMADMTGYGVRPSGFPGLMMALSRLQAMTGAMGAAPLVGPMPMMEAMPMAGATPMPTAMPMMGVCPCCGRPMGDGGGAAFSFDGGPGFSVTTEG